MRPIPNAVSFSLELPDGEVLKQPGNFMFLTETSWFATNEDFLAEGVEGDVDGDGEVSFGEGLPTRTSSWRRCAPSTRWPTNSTPTRGSSSPRLPTRSRRSP